MTKRTLIISASLLRLGASSVKETYLMHRGLPMAAVSALAGIHPSMGGTQKSKKAAARITSAAANENESAGIDCGTTSLLLRAGRSMSSMVVEA